MSARRADPDLPRMDVAEFLRWYEEQPGRFELLDGLVVAMSPARVRHGLVKMSACIALRAAISRAGLPCQAHPDGLGVRTGARRYFEPDALVRCGPPLDGNATEVPDPVIVVEVISPSTKGVDTGRKLDGYFSVPSVAHYLILDPDERFVIHHARTGTDVIAARILKEGRLVLDPPGLDLAVSDLFSAD